MASGMSRKLPYNFKRSIHLSFVVIDLAGLANAERVTLGTRPDPPFDPQLLFEFGGRHAFHAVDHGGAGQFGMHGGADSGARDLLQAVAQTVGERPDTLAHAFGSQAKVKLERRIESGEEGRDSRALLHEPLQAGFLVVPPKTAQRCPDFFAVGGTDI